MSLSASDLSNSCHSPGPSFDADDRISLGDIHALLDWCARLGCTEDELRDAVRKAGPRVQGVKRALGKDLYAGPAVGHLLR